ncbi:MAG: hypothetical protein ACFCGT_05020 [Sandaracinaceae bacterium]
MTLRHTLRRPVVIAWLLLPIGACSAPSGGASTPSAYLRGDPYDRLVIEVDVVSGLMPRDGVAEALIAGLDEILDKPSGIEVVIDETLPGRSDGTPWTFADLRRLSEETFDRDVDGTTATFHTLWLDGTYEGSDGSGSVLGVAWSNRSLAIFADALAGSCRARRPAIREALCREAETAIWTHEAGHVLGLVNNGVPMVEDHEDPDHPAHTLNEDGIMYWAYEGARVVDLLEDLLDAGDGADLGFGPESLADLAAFRDR